MTTLPYDIQQFIEQKARFLHLQDFLGKWLPSRPVPQYQSNCNNLSVRLPVSKNKVISLQFDLYFHHSATRVYENSDTVWMSMWVRMEGKVDIRFTTARAIILSLFQDNYADVYVTVWPCDPSSPPDWARESVEYNS